MHPPLFLNTMVKAEGTLQKRQKRQKMRKHNVTSLKTKVRFDKNGNLIVPDVTRLKDPNDRQKYRKHVLYKRGLFMDEDRVLICPHCAEPVLERGCIGHLLPACGGSNLGSMGINAALTHPECEKEIGSKPLVIKRLEHLQEYVKWLNRLGRFHTLTAHDKKQLEKNLAHYGAELKIRELRAQLLGKLAFRGA